MTMASRAAKRSRLCVCVAVAVAAVCLSPGAWSAKPDCAVARKTYETSCSMCHRADGKGYAAIKTVDFTDQHWQATHKDSELISAISNGVKGTEMLSFKNQLTAQQIEDLVHCVIRRFGKKPTAHGAMSKRASTNSGKDSSERHTQSLLLPARNRVNTILARKNRSNLPEGRENRNPIGMRSSRIASH
jgi:cytochrome c553